jgi:hypothetical protein
VTALERRYRHLLVTYPDDYRRERESEILDALLQAAAPGQRWPSPWQAVALLAGGLRTGGRWAASPATRLADGLRLGVLLALLQVAGTAAGLALVLSPAGAVVGQRGVLGGTAATVAALTTLAALAVVRGRMRTALGLVTAVAATLAAADVLFEPLARALLLWLPLSSWLVVAVTLALLAWRRALAPARRPWPWRLLWVGALAVVPQALLPLPWPVTHLVPWPVASLVWVATLAVPVAVLLAAALVAGDARPALGAGLLAACDLLDRLGAIALVSASPFPQQRIHLAVEAAALLLLAVTAAAVGSRVGRSSGEPTATPPR